MHASQRAVATTCCRSTALKTKPDRLEWQTHRSTTTPLHVVLTWQAGIKPCHKACSVQGGMHTQKACKEAQFTAPVVTCCCGNAWKMVGACCPWAQPVAGSDRHRCIMRPALVWPAKAYHASTQPHTSLETSARPFSQITDSNVLLPTAGQSL